MAELYESGENYLEAILMLKNERGVARSVDVAKKLGVSKPSVSRAMGILEEKGFLTTGEGGALLLTDKGKETAESVYGRHVMLTKFLQKITGVKEAQAEENACRIEHDIDADVAKGIEKWMRKQG